MRIAYVCADDGVPVFGRKGCSVHVQEVIRALRRAGAAVELAATRVGGEPPIDFQDLPLERLPAARHLHGPEREQTAVTVNPAIGAWLESRPPFDLVYERYSLWSHSAMEWASEHGVPGILEVNAPLIEEQQGHRTLHDRATAEEIARKAFGAASCIFAVSNGVRSYLIDRGVKADKVVLVPNGVDLARFSGLPVGATGNDPDDFTVGFVGSLKPWHGLDVLVAAAASACRRGVPVRLLIVGDGPERAGLEAAIGAAGLTGRCELAGAVAPAAIPALLGRMDVAVAPYPDLPRFYFSPLKIFEYMAAGRAIVASRGGDIAGLLGDGSAGQICPPGDVEALSGAIEHLYHEPAVRMRLAREARRAAAGLGWDRVANGILALAGEPYPTVDQVAAC